MSEKLVMADVDIPEGIDQPPLTGVAKRIFEAARALFYERGVRAVGVEEIVTQAGVTKPSLYRNFDSKEDLVIACLEAELAEAEARLGAAIAEAGTDPRDQLRAVIAYKAATMQEPGFRGCPMSNTAVEFPEPGAGGRAVIERGKADFRARLVGLARAMDAREPEALADGLMLLIEGAYATCHVFGSQGPAQTMARTADALIDAHRRVPPGEPAQAANATAA